MPGTKYSAFVIEARANLAEHSQQLLKSLRRDAQYIALMREAIARSEELTPEAEAIHLSWFPRQRWDERPC
jgi:hypothetical protein